MKTVSFEESVVLDAAMLKDAGTKLRMTKDGYMVCSPRIARTGIQEYLGVEMGRPDLEKVRVYRPESEVFDKASIRELAGRPITIEHPDEPVTAANWRDHAVGHVGEDVMRDGEFIRVPLILMDAAAINEVKGGRAELSVGYSAVIEWADGVTPSGEKYNAKQTSIRANHVAITHTARGGPQLRMGDNRRSDMATRTITVDNLTVTLEDRDAQIVERALAKFATDLATAQAALATAQTTAQNDVATARTEAVNAKALVDNKEAEIVTLKKQLVDAAMSPAKLDKMVADRVATVQRAQKIIGDTLVVEGKTDAEMRRQVVAAKLGEVAKDWTDDMISASFNTLSVATMDNGSGGNLGHAVQIIANNDPGGDPRTKAYTDYNNDISNRWKTAGGRTAQ
jgi:uncharacterized protein